MGKNFGWQVLLNTVEVVFGYKCYSIAISETCSSGFFNTEVPAQSFDSACVRMHKAKSLGIDFSFHRRVRNRAGKPIANPRELNRMHAVRVQSESLGIVFGRNRLAECGSIGGQSDQAGHLYSRHLACTVQQSSLAATRSSERSDSHRSIAVAQYRSYRLRSEPFGNLRQALPG